MQEETHDHTPQSKLQAMSAPADAAPPVAHHPLLAAPGPAPNAAGGTIFRIPTMDCAAEESEIRHALAGVAGVQSLNFQLSARTLAIHAPAAVLPQALGAIRRAGFDPQPLGLNINALMSVAVTGAFLIGQWPEAAMVMALYAIAELIEAKAVDRARNAIKGLLELAPEEALVLGTDGAWTATAGGFGGHWSDRAHQAGRTRAAGR
jgi:copper chaperone CopZ